MLAQRANVTCSNFENIVVLARAFEHLFSKTIFPVSRVSLRTLHSTVSLQGIKKLYTSSGDFSVFGVWHVFVYLKGDLAYCVCFLPFQNLNTIVCYCIICCLFGFNLAVH